MHTVRNRLAHIPRSNGASSSARPSPNDVKAPPLRSSRDDIALMLQQTPPSPGFPADMVVPPHRGAVITETSWPTPAPAAGARAAAMPPTAPAGQTVPAGISRKAAKKAARRAAALARKAQLRVSAQASAMLEDLIIEPAVAKDPPVAASHDAAPPIPAAPDMPAGGLPSRSDDVPIPVVRPDPECPLALVLPPESVAPVDSPALVKAAPGPDAPLQPTRALAIRRQGFVDILAFVLRDSGRKLSRWSSARRRADDMKDKLARAENRMRAMEAQLAALQALQERVRQAK